MLTPDVRPTLRSALYGSTALALGAACLSGLALAPASADTVVDPDSRSLLAPASDTVAASQEPEVVVETEEIPEVGTGGPDAVSPQAEVEPYLSENGDDEGGVDEERAEPFERDGLILAAELDDTDTGDFSLLGVTWEANDDASIVVEVRTKTGGTWTEWVDVEAEPDAGEGGRAGTDPLWTGPSAGVAVRVFTEDGQAPEDLELMTIDPDETAADAAIVADSDGTTETALYRPNRAPAAEGSAGGFLADLGETLAVSTAPRPNFIMRSSWGPTAAHPCATRESGQALEGIMVHHTAGNNTYTQAQSPGVVRGIHTYHVSGLGWCDIGYHSLVDRFGNVYEGRRGGLDKMITGAHANESGGVYNQRTWSISVMGNLETGTVTAATRTALVNTAAWKLSLHNRPATGTVSLGGRNLHRISGHKDVSATLCPGKNLYPFVTGAMRTQTRDRIANGGQNATTQINALHQQTGGNSGPLGAATSAFGTRSNGLTFRRYQNGTIYHTGSRTHYLTNPIDRTFRDAGGTQGEFGMPTTNVTTTSHGPTYARFENGRIYQTEHGTHGLTGIIETQYQAMGGTRGELGSPTGSSRTSNDGVDYARFANGTMYRNGSRAHAVLGENEKTYRAEGGSVGILGLPATSTAQSAAGIVYTRFENGTIYDDGNRTYYLTNPIDRTFRDAGGTRGEFGMPTMNVKTTSHGPTYARFENGRIYQTERGTYGLIGVIETQYQAMGGTRSNLGNPTGSSRTSKDGVDYARFENGTMYRNGNNAYAVMGASETTYRAEGGSVGVLGLPTTSTSQASSGLISTRFENGTIYEDDGETYWLTDPVDQRYRAQGGSGGPLGLPTTSISTNSIGVEYARFEHGTVYGLNGGASLNTTYAIWGKIADRYRAEGATIGHLGPPTRGNYSPQANVQQAEFEHGTIRWNQSTGAVTVTTSSESPEGPPDGPPAEIEAVYQQTGGPSGSLGNATSGFGTRSNGLTFRRYQNGTIYHTGSDTFYLTNPIDQVFKDARGTQGEFGMPTTNVTTTSHGPTYARFENGRIYQTEHGTHGLTGIIETQYQALGGTRGDLGSPTASIRTSNGGVDYARFAHGSMYRNGSNAHAVIGANENTYRELDGTKGILGLPTTSTAPANSGDLFTRFENGAIYDDGSQTYWLTNPIDRRYRSLSGTASPLGLPTAHVRTNSIGVEYVRFQHGTIYSPNRGASLDTTYAIWGKIAERYTAEGATTGHLGLPTRGNYSPQANVQQADFEHGTIRWNQSTGETTVTRSSGASGDTFVVPSSGQIPLQGRGFGHGIGMSQHGAQGAAVSGLTYRQILTHYYPGTSVGNSNARIRVHLTAHTNHTLIVQATSELSFRDVSADRSFALPEQVSGQRVTQWRLRRVPGNLAQSQLEYRVGSTWTRYNNTTFTGDGEINRGTAGTMALVHADGSVRSYRSTLRLVKPTSTTRAVVNELSLNNYTRGVVAAEMPTSWHAEALKAQAVAARSYAASHRRTTSYFDICDTTACQVYRGVDAENAAAIDAVNGTSGVIVTHGGSPAVTQYSSSNGGRTAAGNRPYLTAKADPYDSWSGNARHTWSTTLTRTQIQNRYPAIGTLQRIEITGRTGGGTWGGRAGNVRLVGSSGTTTVTGPQFRTAFGLYSHWYGF